MSLALACAAPARAAYRCKEALDRVVAAANWRGGIDRFEDVGRVRPQRPGPGDPDHAIDDEIGCRGDAVDDPAAGLAEGG